MVAFLTPLGAVEGGKLGCFNKHSTARGAPGIEGV